MEDEESQNSGVNRSDINYVRGISNSLLVQKQEENFPCCKFSNEVSDVDYTVIGAHITGSCTKPYVKVRLYSDLPIGDREREGVLTDRMIEVCSCCLDVTAMPGKYALSTCVLEKKGLQNIEILGCHQYLKHLNLSGNFLESVEILGKLPFLEYLDVSHNLLTTLADFEAPLNLSYLNYSYNLIETMTDLEKFWGLVYLDVSHNLIVKIFGLDTLKYLNYIDLSHNKIERLENVNNLNVQTLILDFNNIKDFEYGNEVGLHTLARVSHISVANNSLESLEFLRGVRTVESVDVSDNHVTDIIELTHLKQMPYLTSLNILGNPVVENPKFRTVCLIGIERLDLLNGEEVSVEETGELKFMAAKTPDEEFRYNSTVIETLNHQKRSEIDSTVIPCYQKFVSMIILVGPMSSKRDIILNKILDAYPTFAKKGVSCTTRPPTNKEIHGRDYYFISEDEFKKLLLDGKFICCSHKYGYSYGLSYDEIRKISEAIGILFVNCDVTSALQIKSKFLNSKLVLSLPRSERSHSSYLQRKFSTSQWINNYLKGYVLNYKDSKSRTSRRKSSKPVAVIKSDYFNTETNKMEKADITPRISILKSSKVEKKDQNVSFNNPTYRLYPSVFSRESEFSPTSISQALIPGHSTPFPLSSVSTETSVATDKSGSCSTTCSKAGSVDGPKSASRTVTVNESMVLAHGSNDNVNNNKEGDVKKPASSIRSSRKSSRVLSTSTDASELFISVSQTIKDQDEYILSVLLSKTNVETSIDSESIDFVDSFRRVESSSNYSIDLTQTDPMLLDYFIETQLMRRRLYLQLYDKYPGLFYTIVNTDDTDEAYEKLTGVLKTCVNMQNKHIFVTKTQCKNIYVCKEMRDAKLKMIFDAIN